MNSKPNGESKLSREKPEKRDIYLAKLGWDESQIGAVKIGCANCTDERVKAFRTKAFAFASSCTLVASSTHTTEVAERLESIIKSEFRQFKDPRFPKNTEILLSASLHRLTWAYKKVAKSPHRCREIFWRAANLKPCLRGKPRLKLYESTGPKIGRYTSFKIADLVRERLPNINLHSELLDSGLAHAVVALETPYSIAVIYKICIQATDQIPYFDDIHPPEWRARDHLGKKIATLFLYYREDYDDECMIETALTEPMGFFEVRFMEVTSKSRKSRKISVTKSCGMRLSRPLIDEILRARFSKGSSLDKSLSELESTLQK